MSSDLGLRATFGPLELIATSEPPEPDQAQGKPTMSVAAMLADFSLDTWTQVDTGRSDIALYRSRGAPSVICLNQQDVLERLQGEPIPAGEQVAFNTGAHRVQLRVVGADEEAYLLDGHEGTIKTYRLADALAQMPPAENDWVEVAIPPVEAWGRAAKAEEWLIQEARQLSESPAPVDRLAAAGLLARLYSAPEGQTIAPEDHPRCRVQAWLKEIDPKLIREVESLAIERIWGMVERIAAVERLRDSDAREEVTSLVRERDDLQALRRALRLAQAGERLVQALELLDDVARLHMSALTGRLPPIEDDPEADRWYAVAWQEPNAWWTGLS